MINIPEVCCYSFSKIKHQNFQFFKLQNIDLVQLNLLGRGTTTQLQL